MLYKVKIFGLTQNTQIFFAGVTRRTATSVGTAAPSPSAQIEMESPNIKIQMKLSTK